MGLILVLLLNLCGFASCLAPVLISLSRGGNNTTLSSSASAPGFRFLQQLGNEGGVAAFDLDLVFELGVQVVAQ